MEAVIFDVVAEIQAAGGSGSMQYEIYPNPVGEKIEIGNLRTGIAVDISIYNMLGEKIYSAADCRTSTINCQFLSSGMYWIEIGAGEKTFRTKFIKE